MTDTASALESRTAGPLGEGDSPSKEGLTTEQERNLFNMVHANLNVNLPSAPEHPFLPGKSPAVTLQVSSRTPGLSGQVQRS